MKEHIVETSMSIKVSLSLLYLPSIWSIHQYLSYLTASCSPRQLYSFNVGQTSTTLERTYIYRSLFLRLLLNSCVIYPLELSHLISTSASRQSYPFKAAWTFTALTEASFGCQNNRSRLASHQIQENPNKPTQIGPTPDVMLHGQTLSWDQMVPVLVISDRTNIKEVDKPLILQLLLSDLWWSGTKALKNNDFEALLHATRDPGESDQKDRLRALRDLYDSQTKHWKKQEWERYNPVASRVPEMFEAVESMDYQDLKVVVFSMTFTSLCVLEVITVLEYVRQQRGLSIPPAWISRPDRLVAFMTHYTERERPLVWDGVMEIRDENKTQWVERFKEALKVGNIPMKD